MINKSISWFRMNSLLSLLKTKLGKSTPFSFSSSSHIHTSNQPIIRKSDLTYAFDCIENIDEASSLFHYMLQMKPIPSSWDYLNLFKVIVKMGHYSQVIYMFKKLSLLGCRVNVYIMNTVINCYARLKEVELGFAIVAHFFKRGYAPNVVCFNRLIKGFFLKGNVGEAVALFKNLIPTQFTDEIIISTVLDGLSKSGNIVDALDLLMISEKNGWKLNVVCYSTIIDGLCKSRMLKDGMELLHRMIDRGILPNAVTCNIFLYGLCKHNKLDLACSIFNDLPSKGISPNVITYTAMIQGLCKAGLFQEAKGILEMMEGVGCFPDCVTYNIIIQGCLQLQYRHNVCSINLLRQIVGRDFQLRAATFFLLLGQVKVLHQMHSIYGDYVINQLIRKLISSSPTHQMWDNNDESTISSSIQKLIH